MRRDLNWSGVVLEYVFDEEERECGRIEDEFAYCPAFANLGHVC
jgi:hypothetical protein